MKSFHVRWWREKNRNNIIKNNFNMNTIFTRLGVRFYRTSPKAKLEVTPLLHEIIMGTMLGDAHAENTQQES